MNLPPGEDTMIAHGQPIERACRVCGCTQNAACIDDKGQACWWEEPDLCSHCVQFVDATAAMSSRELRTMAAKVLQGQHGAAAELDARLLLLRLERGIEWVMVPSERGETMYAVIGSTQTFSKNASVTYAHALGERIGPIEGIDRAQATVVAEAVHATSTKRRREYQDLKDQAQANGWVVYGRKGLEERAGDLLKAAGIEWLSISLGGVDLDGVAIITLNGPVPDELPDGILREKPGASK